MSIEFNSSEANSGSIIKTAEDPRVILKLVDRLNRQFENCLKEDLTQLSVTQWNFLDSLSLDEPVRPFVIANSMNLSRQNVAQTIKKLQSLDLVSVSKPKEDERAVLVSITSAGIDALARIGERFSEIADEMNKEMPKLGTFNTKRILRVISRGLASGAPQKNAS